jgi:hypothetical protein
MLEAARVEMATYGRKTASGGFAGKNHCLVMIAGSAAVTNAIMMPMQGYEARLTPFFGLTANRIPPAAEWE